jgi:DNA-binding PadR family transcriptional regulator
MTETHPPYRNLWALTVLCLLRERPMHPYEMQRLIRQRNKYEFLELKRGSLYHNIDWLQRTGLIAPLEKSREGRRPERTVYGLIDAGERKLISWLRDILANPGRGSVHFQAALSFLGHLGPDDVVEQLVVRLNCLEKEIESLKASLRELVPRIGRLLVIESEYTQATKQAELSWTRSLIEDIRRGSLSWRPEDFVSPPGPGLR